MRQQRLISWVTTTGNQVICSPLLTLTPMTRVISRITLDDESHVESDILYVRRVLGTSNKSGRNYYRHTPEFTN
jgi:hypothetical protein